MRNHWTFHGTIRRTGHRIGRRVATVLAFSLPLLWLWPTHGEAQAPMPASSVAASVDEELPPLELVRGIRAARVAHLEGDHDTEQHALRRLATGEAETLPALWALLRFLEEHPNQSAEDLASLRAELTATVTKKGADVPLDVLSLLASQHDDPAALRAIADELERRVAAQPTDKPTLVSLYNLRVRLDDADGAIEARERMFEIEPTLANRRELLYLYRSEQRWQDAADLVREWIGLAESKAHLRRVYIGMLSRLGRLDQIEEQVELMLAEIMGKDEHTRRVYYRAVRSAAWNLRDAGRDDAAERLFRRVAELDPKDEETLATLLHLYGSEEELEQLAAVESKKWAEEDDPQSLFEEGTTRLTAGDAEGAFPLLKRAAPGLPDLEPAWYNLGMAAYRLEEWDAVADAFGRAGELNDRRAHTFLYRGLALEKLGRCAESVVALERAIELDSSLTNAHYYLASCYARIGRNDDAARHRKLYAASQ